MPIEPLQGPAVQEGVAVHAPEQVKPISIELLQVIDETYGDYVRDYDIEGAEKEHVTLLLEGRMVWVDDNSIEVSLDPITEAKILDNITVSHRTISQRDALIAQGYVMSHRAPDEQGEVILRKCFHVGSKNEALACIAELKQILEGIKV